MVEVPAAFGACLACHRINGTNAAVALDGMAGLSGYIQGPLDTDEADAVTAQDQSGLTTPRSSRDRDQI